MWTFVRSKFDGRALSCTGAHLSLLYLRVSKTFHNAMSLNSESEQTLLYRKYESAFKIFLNSASYSAKYILKRSIYLHFEYYEISEWAIYFNSKDCDHIKASECPENPYHKHHAITSHLTCSSCSTKISLITLKAFLARHIILTIFGQFFSILDRISCFEKDI